MKKPIVKQLKVMIQICSRFRSESNSEYLDNLKSELQLALDTVEGEKNDFEYSTDTESYNELIA